MNSGFLKVCAASPRVTVGGAQQNLENALREIRFTAEKKVKVLAFPELYLSGYTCGDLFLQKTLTDACLQALEVLCEKTVDVDMMICIGLPLRVNTRLYNCAAVLYKGKVLGFVPKTYIPNYGEYYEKRWFASGKMLDTQIRFGHIDAPCRTSLLFPLAENGTLGVEICEDLWVPNPPSTDLTLAGANVIVNLSASNEAVTKNEYRKEIIAAQSAKCFCAYVYASAGVGESSTDLVFSGACTIAENGAILSEGERFAFDGTRAIADIDLDKLNAERIRNGSFSDNADTDCQKYTICEAANLSTDFSDITRTFQPHPFVPSDTAEKDERCREILAIQSHGLAKRLAHTRLEKAVVGISGGLDSTLALLVSVRAMQILQLPPENLICVTMPGFGTTDRTYQNAVALIKSFGASFLEIPIKDAALLHMQDIGHNPDLHDITYENTQAR
ncbi:MAG: NAD(+) synthase, partial [Candidatus Fimenecus sp.]